MNLGRGRPSVKVLGGGREEAASVMGVMLSLPVIAERLERPMMMAVTRANKARMISGRRLALEFGAVRGATAGACCRVGSKISV
jgi:hypothetical protein